ncbi:ATP-dependent RNA helicase DDX52/ROK1 [Fistulifera solaris]|uniref:RNA helicase n=1 Tax=Fistulifera solaris TaxID=1519565 RepID=A0A1Z5JN72_FISSO|nr:ATP-dependent RNA helicase DDX52/ROK1 [Fistulifera solaris]|eukprot:GAX15228.1 ATP-dependent RNA helicase DDX52/ROK1 [Fistulifera solaris]
MDEIFNILSSSARIDKSKRQKRKRETVAQLTEPPPEEHVTTDDDDESDEEEEDEKSNAMKSRDRTGKRDVSEAKRNQIHREEVAAFRRSMKIKVAHADDSPDPISSFSEITCPEWCNDSFFTGLIRVILCNIEEGKWKEPTPIQMQSIPALMQRRDLLAGAPTGSGKSGAFILPSLLLSSIPHNIFYKTKGAKKNKGEIPSLILAPSLELASQLHRQVERLGLGKPGGLSSLLLAKANAAQAVLGQVGGQSGLDVLISTPLRIVDAIQKGLKLDSVRIVVLDEADRLLDASDSGSDKSRTFLSQIDTILSEIPATATRALFSATVTPTVRTLSESILRNPVVVSIDGGGAANADIDQRLMFVGNEQGKLLAIRQLVQRGEFDFPALVFCQSQERAQALFAELLYDGIRVDVIHAGRSKAARENAVAKFRKGDTWVLIGTDLVARGVDLSAVKLVLNYDLPQSGVTYVHRIGRTGRAGRKGKAITLFTEADLEQLRTIANIMKQSGCQVEDWMLQLPRKHNKKKRAPKRQKIDTTPSYDKKKSRMKRLYIKNSKEKKEKEAEESG